MTVFPQPSASGARSLMLKREAPGASKPSRSSLDKARSAWQRACCGGGGEKELRAFLGVVGDDVDAAGLFLISSSSMRILALASYGCSPLATKPATFAMKAT